MFALSVVLEESKHTYVRTHVQTGLRFIYQTRGLQSFPTVTNKEICFISVVFILCKALRYLFARLLTEGKTLFSSQADCCVRHLLRQNCYDDIVKFQSDLAILASSKNFDKRLA